MRIVQLKLPGSKSISNRALILAALCNTPSKLSSLLISDDTITCQQALAQRHTSKPIIMCNDAGTVARFLLPVYAALGGEYVFDASARLRVRPIGPLINLLQQQGVDFEWLDICNRMPLKMYSRGLPGGKLCVDVQESSQFLSGLLMAAPLTHQGLCIQSTLPLFKLPYVNMTLHLMRIFGVYSSMLDAYTVQVDPAHYIATDFLIEPDATTASYFFAAAAIMQNSIKIMGLTKHSIQGDLRFLELLKIIGCAIKYADDYIQVTGPKNFAALGNVNMQGFTDTFMTICIIAPFLPTVTTLTGLRHTRLQESDRIQAMVDGLNTVGIKTIATEDSLSIFPGSPHAGLIVTQHDHRIAMSFAILGLRIPGIILDDIACVAKTCPTFFDLLENSYGK